MRSWRHSTTGQSVRTQAALGGAGPERGTPGSSAGCWARTACDLQGRRAGYSRRPPRQPCPSSEGGGSVSRSVRMKGNKVLLVKMTEINTNISWQKRKSEGFASAHTRSLEFWKDRIPPPQSTVLRSAASAAGLGFPAPPATCSVPGL